MENRIILTKDNKRKLDYEIRLVCEQYKYVDVDDLIDYVTDIIRDEFEN